MLGGNAIIKTGYQIQGQNNPILVYSRVNGRKYIYMGLSYKYTENDQVQGQAFFKYSVVHYKYIWHVIWHVLGYNYQVPSTFL